MSHEIHSVTWAVVDVLDRPDTSMAASRTGGATRRDCHQDPPRSLWAVPGSVEPQAVRVPQAVRREV
ncbi:MAG: hypothetical protein LBV06_09120 [Propionibacteriaceae bacterium]|nr:hypothetical protein [Propionibacteriaceae bacterium]